MPEEIEVKFRLIDRVDLVRQLEAADAELLYDETFEDNIILDRRGELKTRGAVLRVRRFGRYVLVTYKGALRFESGVKRREEVQTSVESFDRAIALFGALGYKPVFRYQKYREVWRLKETEVVLDRTPIGNFFEIEGSMAFIKDVVELLGLRLEDAVKLSYVDLYRQERRTRAELPEHMVFDPEDLPGR